MKKAGIVLLAIGTALILISLILTFAMMVMPLQNGAIGIIGGADGPTLWLLHSKTFLPMTEAGLAACIAGVILLVLKK